MAETEAAKLRACLGSSEPVAGLGVWPPSQDALIASLVAGVPFHPLPSQ